MKINNVGFEYMGRISSLSQSRIEVSIVSRSESKAEPPIQMTVAQAFLKEKKMDTLVRQLTELGMAKWLPFSADRSVPKPDEQRLSNREKRWGTIAREAVKQCRRGRIPEIGAASNFEKVLVSGEEHDLNIIFIKD